MTSEQKLRELIAEIKAYADKQYNAKNGMWCPKLQNDLCEMAARYSTPTPKDEDESEGIINSELEQELMNEGVHFPPTGKLFVAYDDVIELIQRHTPKPTAPKGDIEVIKQLEHRYYNLKIAIKERAKKYMSESELNHIAENGDDAMRYLSAIPEPKVEEGLTKNMLVGVIRKFMVDKALDGYDKAGLLADRILSRHPAQEPLNIDDSLEALAKRKGLEIERCEHNGKYYVEFYTQYPKTGDVFHRVGSEYRTDTEIKSRAYLMTLTDKEGE